VILVREIPEMRNKAMHAVLSTASRQSGASLDGCPRAGHPMLERIDYWDALQEQPSQPETDMVAQSLRQPCTCVKHKSDGSSGGAGGMGGTGGGGGGCGGDGGRG
jgi:hypothetical protein